MNCNAGSGIFNQTQTLPTCPNADATATFPGQTTGFGEWGQVFPVNPNMTTNSGSIMSPQINIPEQQAQSANMNMSGTMPNNSQETLADYVYTPGYLRANIGNLMRVEFLIGNGTTSRVGILREVGASYIVLDSLDNTSRMMCDIFSIRFVTILPNTTGRAMLGNFITG